VPKKQQTRVETKVRNASLRSYYELFTMNLLRGFLSPSSLRHFWKTVNLLCWTVRN